MATVVVLGTYLSLSLAANWPAWSHGIAHSIETSGGSDVQEEIWFLAQTPWAIIHGINPFGNSLLNAPFGINLMDNGSVPLLGVIGAPITLLFGPLATFNVLFDLSFGLSAMAFFLMARRLVSWQPAAFIGGLLYGFSPFAVAAGHGHLFLIFDPVLPLIVLIVDRVWRTGESAPLTGGVLFGLCLIAQFYISTEIFASVVVMSAIAAVIVAGYLLWRRIPIDRARLGTFAAAAAVVSTLGIGYGAWTAIAGPDHITGPAQSEVSLAGLSADPLGWITPTINQRFSAGLAGVGDPLVAQRNSTWHVVIDNAAENGTYVGLPLLAVLAGGAVRYRRRRAVRLCAILAGVAVLLAMGTHLHLDGKLTWIPLPFIVIAHLPLLDSSVAARYMLFFWLFAAIVLALVIDGIHSTLASHVQERRRTSLRLAPAAICGLLSVAALVPLVPSWPYPASGWNPPAWFLHAGRSMTVKSTVLIYPLASSSNSSSMLWQAQADMSFRMPGGYAVFASPSGVATFSSRTSPIQMALALCSEGVTLSLPAATVSTQLRAWHVDFVVVPFIAPHSACARRLFVPTLGQPTDSEGVMLWRAEA